MRNSIFRSPHTHFLPIKHFGVRQNKIKQKCQIGREEIYYQVFHAKTYTLLGFIVSFI